MELTTGSEGDKIETAIRKKNYDLYLKKLRKQSTSDFINNSHNKQRAVWEVINYEKCNNSKKDEPLKLIINEKLIQDPLEITEHFNHYFTKIADITLCNANQAINSQLTTWKDYGDVPDFIPLSTTPEEVLHILTSLKSKPAAGVDEVSSTLLKHCKDEIANPYVT
ncbi:hypothetical protein J6590_013884 [Homalodisca vitripennis]|nr:hypothetical protein J6590_013884 [Homalodisca vitripennis]